MKEKKRKIVVILVGMLMVLSPVVGLSFAAPDGEPEEEPIVAVEDEATTSEEVDEENSKDEDSKDEDSDEVTEDENTEEENAGDEGVDADNSTIDENTKGEDEESAEGETVADFSGESGDITAQALPAETGKANKGAGTTGDVTYTTVDAYGVAKSVAITGNGAMANYSSSNYAPWGTNIVTATINSGVTNIGAYAFSSCASLETVSIPTTVKKVGSYAFSGCNNPNLALTFYEELNANGIGSNAFYGCAVVNYVTDNGVAAWNTAGGASSGATKVRFFKKDSASSVEPTCTEKGLYKYTYQYTKTAGNIETPTPTIKDLTVPALGHDMVVTPAKASGCNEDTPVYGNNKYYTCSRCSKVFKDAAGETETTVEAETLPLAPHTWRLESYIDQATCTEAGYGTYVCDVCNVTEDREVPALGHDLDDGIIIVEPTKKTPGTVERTCMTCGAHVTEPITWKQYIKIFGIDDEDDDEDDEEDNDGVAGAKGKSGHGNGILTGDSAAFLGLGFVLMLLSLAVACVVVLQRRRDEATASASSASAVPVVSIGATMPVAPESMAKAAALAGRLVRFTNALIMLIKRNPISAVFGKIKNKLSFYPVYWEISSFAALKKTTNNINESIERSETASTAKANVSATIKELNKKSSDTKDSIDGVFSKLQRKYDSLLSSMTIYWKWVDFVNDLKEKFNGKK